eukprot:31555-Pelagococcus_subviridis.AAC.28
MVTRHRGTNRKRRAEDAATRRTRARDEGRQREREGRHRDDVLRVGAARRREGVGASSCLVTSDIT